MTATTTTTTTTTVSARESREAEANRKATTIEAVLAVIDRQRAELEREAKQALPSLEDVIRGTRTPEEYVTLTLSGRKAAEERHERLRVIQDLRERTAAEWQCRAAEAVRIRGEADQLIRLVEGIRRTIDQLQARLRDPLGATEREAVTYDLQRLQSDLAAKEEQMARLTDRRPVAGRP